MMNMFYNMLYIMTTDVNKDVSLLHVLINNKSSMEDFVMGLIYIFSFIWGILSIILFFKVWGMTNRVIDIQNLFEKHSKNVDDKLGVLISTLEKMKEMPKTESNPNKAEIKQPKDNLKDAAKTANLNVRKEKEAKAISPKTKREIDESSNEFKQKLHKWQVLKEKGFIEQAIEEYQEYTGLDYDEAVGFIKEL